MKISPKFRTIVLSGGGIRGFCHLGFLKYLEEHDMTSFVDTLFCTSVGSIIGACWVLGMTSDQIKEAFYACNTAMLKMDGIQHLFTKFGISNAEYFIAHLYDTLLKNNINPLVTFKEVSKRLFITGTNLTTHQVEYFSATSTPNMRILDAVRISIAIPFLISPQQYNGTYYVDGGISVNFPMAAAIDDFNERYAAHTGFTLSENIIGCALDEMPPTAVNSIEDFAYNVIACIIKRQAAFLSPYTVVIDTCTISPFSFDTDPKIRDDMFERGYTTTNIYINNLMKNKIKRRKSF